ncbi:alpha/beta fold hydrolase [Amycolatopsis sp. NPDC005003]
MESTQSLAIDGQRIHYVRAGRGPAVVLLHGSGSSWPPRREVAG